MVEGQSTDLDLRRVVGVAHAGSLTRDELVDGCRRVGLGECSAGRYEQQGETHQPFPIGLTPGTSTMSAIAVISSALRYRGLRVTPAGSRGYLPVGTGEPRRRIFALVRRRLLDSAHRGTSLTGELLRRIGVRAERADNANVVRFLEEGKRPCEFHSVVFLVPRALKCPA